MKIFFSLLALIILSTNIYSTNKYNVLYLNSGNGNYKIERRIYSGIEETLKESDNISLYTENLDLFTPRSNRVYTKLSDLIIHKYQEINFDIIILINRNSKVFFDSFLKESVKYKNIMYADYVSNSLPAEPFIDNKINNIYYYSNITELLNLLKDNFPVEKVYVIKKSWEFIPDIKIKDLKVEIINYSDKINDLILINDFVYLTPYVMEFNEMFVNNFLISSWENSNTLLKLNSTPKVFGNRVAYLSKLKILGIDTKLTTEEYQIAGKTIDYKISSKIKTDINPKLSYINIPRSKYEEDPTLIYRNIIFILSISFLILLISIITINKVQRNRLLIESKQQLFNLINVLPLPIHARDSKGKYIFVNDTFLQVNHIKSRKDIINLSINNTPGLSPEEITIFLKQDKEVLDINKTKIYESVFFDPVINQQKVFKVYKSPLQYYNIESVLCVLDDVSDLKNAEAQVKELNKNLEEKIQQRTVELENSLDELKKTQNELVETRKMASLTTLVSGIAHEMNTPLGITLTQTTYLFDMTKSLLDSFNNHTLKKTELENYISKTIEAEDIVIGSLKRAIKMVNRFKEVAVQKTDYPEKFNLYLFIHQQITIYLLSLKKSNVNLIIDINKDINIITYKDALFKVLENLIDNSINHGFDNDGGEITIKCSTANKDLILYYEDNGKGVISDELNRLFDPFFTTNRNKGQIGLGLSIVYATIRNKIKGKIDYYIPENSIGLGFKILLEGSII